MPRLTGTWTKPGSPLPSSHLIKERGDGRIAFRCGRVLADIDPIVTSPEPPARGKTCESCLRYSRRDG